MALSRNPRSETLAALTALAVVLLAIGGCSRQDPQPGVTSPAAASAPLPATEYFEGLTEEAFTAPDNRLDALIDLARTASDRDRRALSPAMAAELDDLLTRIGRHRAAMNRADLAIASIEAYRLFVSASPGSDPIPRQVSLLDYAGFRFSADLKAGPTRWDDAATALDYADSQWSQISGRVTDTAVRNRFSSALIEMRTALAAHDLAGAKQAGLRELDLVDELETWFSRPFASSTSVKGAT